MRTFTLLGLTALSFGFLNASKLDWLEGSGDDEDEEGSGIFSDNEEEEEEEELQLVPDEEILGDEYYYDDYPDEDTLLDYDKVLESYDADDDYDYTEDEDDSVLKIQPDIEIKPRPENGEEAFVIETSQLLIMIGSAFVSFAVVMLVFFTCRRSMQQKAMKAAEIQKIRQGPIVKSYHRVPGGTLQYLESSHIDMYSGAQAKQGQPLIE